MKVLIPTIMYGRWKTFKAFVQGIDNLKKAFPKIDFEVLAVGTGDEDICDYYGIEYHDYPNNLAQKAQYRLSLCKDRADYYLFLGSDDVIDANLFSYYLDRIKEGYNWIAPLDLYVWKEGKMYYATGYPQFTVRYGEPIAVGRMLSNDVLNKCEWELWTSDREKNIDREAYARLLGATTDKHFFSIRGKGVVLDIKTKDNISQFNRQWVEMGKPEAFLDKNICETLYTLR